MVIDEEGPVQRLGMISLGLAVLLVLLLTGAAWAGHSADNGLNWQLLGSGGAPAASGVAALNGSLGQTAIGPSNFGDVGVGGGYWYGVGGGIVSWDYQAHLPLVLRTR
jgi:hypothetical protein